VFLRIAIWNFLTCLEECSKMKPFRVFVSSVQSEFKEERTALREFIEKINC